MEEMKDAFAPWRCPECDANLSARYLICLNACHLSSGSRERFAQQMQEAWEATNAEAAEGAMKVIENYGPDELKEAFNEVQKGEQDGRNSNPDGGDQSDRSPS